MRLFLSFSFFSIVMMFSSCGEPKPTITNDVSNTFKKYCALCHGMDGSLKLNGAKDFSESTMSLEERIMVVRKGKNSMTPFEGILTEEQIKELAQYTMQFSK